MLRRLIAQKRRCSVDISEIPREKYRMYLERLEFADKHFMISVSCNQDHIVKLPEGGKLVCLKSKPYVHTLLDHFSLTIRPLYLAQMLVVEHHVVLYQRIFKFPLIVQQMLVVGLSHPETPSKIMSFRNLTRCHIHPLLQRYFGAKI